MDLQQAQLARDDKARQLTVIQVAMDEAKKQRDSALADSEKRARTWLCWKKQRIK